MKDIEGTMLMKIGRIRELSERETFIFWITASAIRTEQLNSRSAELLMWWRKGWRWSVWLLKRGTDELPFKNIWDIPAMEKVVKERFNGKYPARKSIQTEFADPNNLLFQVDAIAYSAK